MLSDEKIAPFLETSFCKELGFDLHLPQHIKIACCEYDVENFYSGLFSKADIEMPASIINAVIKRQAEFFAGRLMAKIALEKLFPEGVQVPDVGISHDRSPLWPQNIIGSITHNSNKAISIVSRRRDWRMLGIDVEDIFSPELSSEVGTLIHSYEEHSLLINLGIPANVATTLIFSAKESLFKAAYPSVGRFFGFECASVKALDLSQQLIYLQVSKPISAAGNFTQSLSCRYMIHPERVTTLLIY